MQSAPQVLRGIEHTPQVPSHAVPEIRPVPAVHWQVLVESGSLPHRGPIGMSRCGSQVEHPASHSPLQASA
jgi:hypothetical protein